MQMDGQMLKRIVELEAALKDALWAGDVFFSQCCGCALIVPQDYRDYEEAEKRIEKARKALPEEES